MIRTWIIIWYCMLWLFETLNAKGMFINFCGKRSNANRWLLADWRISFDYVGERWEILRCIQAMKTPIIRHTQLWNTYLSVLRLYFCFTKYLLDSVLFSVINWINSLLIFIAINFQFDLFGNCYFILIKSHPFPIEWTTIYKRYCFIIDVLNVD